MKTKLYFRTWLAISIFLLQTLKSQTILTPSEGANTNGKQIRITLGTGGKEKAPTTVIKTVDLQQLAVTMELRAIELRNEAAGSEGDTKKLLLEEAINIEKLAIMMQIEAYEQSGIKNYALFKSKGQTIRALLLGPGLDEDIFKPVTLHIGFAERNMKLAVEMREEANAENKPAVKLGRLSNADEKEVLALNEQDQAIDLIQTNRRTSLSLR